MMSAIDYNLILDMLAYNLFWRWEYLRRNKEYKKAYEKVCNNPLWKKLKTEPDKNLEKRSLELFKDLEASLTDYFSIGGVSPPKNPNTRRIQSHNQPDNQTARNQSDDLPAFTSDELIQCFLEEDKNITELYFGRSSYHKEMKYDTDLGWILLTYAKLQETFFSNMGFGINYDQIGNKYELFRNKQKINAESKELFKMDATIDLTEDIELQIMWIEAQYYVQNLFFFHEIDQKCLFDQQCSGDTLFQLAEKSLLKLQRKLVNRLGFDTKHRDNLSRAYGLWLWDKYQEQLKKKKSDKNKMKVLRSLGEKHPETRLKDEYQSYETIPKKFRRYLDRTDECIKARKILPWVKEEDEDVTKKKK